MVDIKREDITLQDWTKGISADEFAWGSYFYSEAISSWYNSKGFELWHYVKKSILNQRSNWYPVALVPSNDYWIVAFTRDATIEWEEFNNWTTIWDGDGDGWGAIASLLWQWYNFVNWVFRWNYLIWIEDRYVDVFDTTDLFTPADELLTEPRFSNSGANRTVGTWWTITDAWATHTTWNTGTLSATINFQTTPTSSNYVRVAVKIVECTAGNVGVKLNNPTTSYSTTSSKDWWYVFSLKCSSSSSSLTITPQSSFNWTIEAVNVHLYGSGFNLHKVNLTWITTWIVPHPALVWEWDLYIAAWSYVNIISLTDFWKEAKQLVDKTYTIVSMTQQAGNIIIWATDWFDSKQYYRNGVDAVATEVIERKWLIIKWVTWTETISYVLTASWDVAWWDGYEYRLYAVSWYQRSLIASKLYQYMSSSYLGQEPYNINKKFDFNDVDGDASMVMFLDSLYIPWCDGVYKYWYDVPWLKSAWTRPIKYDTGATHITLWQRNAFLNVGYRVDNINYIWRVNERLYAPKWYLITESIYRDKLSTRKALEKLKIWYKNVASSVWNIKVYAIVDDNYFRRFRVSSTPTTRPSVWDVYNIAHSTTGKVIDVDKTNWIITFVTVSDMGSYNWIANTALTKVSGDWDASISVGHKFDNMCLIKTIENDTQGYGSDLIFWKNFVNNYIPYWHKIQFVIELSSNNTYLSPEIYEISMVSDITDVIL